ncbi:MAG: hypothetical protein OXD43_09630 [Bacteroidetes bacterium]|nr:hypothetical protein [Bacteroidota bacterium]
MGTVIVVEIPALVVLIFLQWNNFRRAKQASDDLLEEIGVRKDLTIDQFDRLGESYLDGIRRFSNAALVIGIGGTMLLFVIGIIGFMPFLSLDADSMPDSMESSIVWGIIFALFSSLVGLGCHLLIVLRILPATQDKVAEKAEAIIEKESTFKIPSLMGNGDLGGLTIFVEVMQSFAQKVLDSQDEMQRVQLQTSDGIKNLTSAAEGITTATDHLASTIAPMGTLPERLEEIIDGSCSAWENRIEDGQDSFVNAIKELLTDIKNRSERQGKLVKAMKEGQDDLQRITEDFLVELKGMLEPLPNNIRDSLEGLDNIFGRAAERHVQALRDAFLQEIDDLRRERTELSGMIAENQEKLKNWFVSQSSTIVGDIFEALRRDVDEQIVVPLKRMGSYLEGTTEQMPAAAKQFGTNLQQSANTLSEIPEELKKVTVSINETLQSTTNEALMPVVGQTEKLLKTMQKTHAGMDITMDNLIEFIKELIQTIEKKRQ